MDALRTVADRYELRQVVGRGGMAKVHLAHDRRLARTVAVKLLLPDLARDAVFQARFRREAQSAASLNHPAVVAVYDTGEEEVDGVSTPFIVMEYVEGATLRELLSGGRGSPEWALEMCAGVLDALEYAHQHGIVHRDIKPANVMLTGAGRVKVMDFGIARAMGDAGMTQTNSVVGTAQYLSPEQARGEPVDTRSDLYSTGCLLYELLTQRPPFTGDSPVSVAYQHVNEEPAPPGEFVPGLTGDADAVVLKALAKDRDHRYQSAAEMRADIEALLAHRPPAAAGRTAADPPTAELRPRPGPATRPLPPVPGAPRRGSADRQRTSGNWKIPLAVLTVLLLVGAAVVGFALLGGGDEGGGTDGGSGGAATLTVPELAGMSLGEARERAAEDDFEIAEGGSRPCAAAEDTVCETSPAAGTEIDPGGLVTLIMSSGAESVEVPDVTGGTADEARRLLDELGFDVAEEEQTAEALAPVGTVLAQDPEGGTDADPGSTVTLTVQGEAPEEEPATVSVPEVTGLPFEEAEPALREAGFEVARQDVPGDAPAGEVVGTSPAAGTQHPAGGTVTVSVSTGPQDGEQPDPGEPVRIPDVSGLAYAEADAALQALGLDTMGTSYPAEDQGCVPEDIVRYTSPAAGETLEPGGRIYLNCYRGP
ncbi:Stk1 family PASTA domain-containing Ser/Thr kinase [Streptomyces johnsoniae]|uniref:non-specific serine/threonine protein kinase n=1 Tax=Streptomyces johnsoniae TaxID=3075532 RepID=A0ABU2S7B4_9ACTN|nr:Stk1 family PASTA domain-containing Ser/Thr kinase [Streptomyces sp. DSM 41886]MDT0444863.1 Stk1 family PASTA domain-containing Ser/Thr kinase [Streptomyces sp. DSM 41886]